MISFCSWLVSAPSGAESSFFALLLFVRRPRYQHAKPKTPNAANAPMTMPVIAPPFRLLPWLSVGIEEEAAPEGAVA